MATIRTQFRALFASSIMVLLLIGSVTVWLWARYIINEQVQALIRRDVNRLAAEIVWQPQLGAFELRSSPTSILHVLTSDYWQISDPEGRILWRSDSWSGYAGALPDTDFRRATKVFEIPSPSGKSLMLASVRDVTVDESSTSSAITEFPPAVLRTLRRIMPLREIFATQMEFADDQFKYEVIARNNDELLEVEIDEQGNLLEQRTHRIPTTLPATVSETFDRGHPGAAIERFDWRASQGHLQFIISANANNRKFKEAIDTSGQVIPLYFPPQAEGRQQASFRILVADEQRWRYGLLRQLGWLLAGVCAIGLLAASMISLWLADRALQPIGSIARKTRLIDERRLSERLTGGRPEDEVGLLVQAVNGMLDRIERAFDRQRRFARDASHELRGPLTGLIAQLELARSQMPADHPATSYLDRALERGQRLRDLIEKLLLLARQESDQPVSMRADIEVNELLSNVAADFPDDRRQRIRLHPGETDKDGLCVHGNEELLHAMYRNLIDNALKYSGGSAPVDVSIHAADEKISVEVRDHGPGIPETAREQVFEPFVRLRDPAAGQAEGVGLGLSIVRFIADLHHAELAIESEPGQGTAITVSLPEAIETPPLALPAPPRKR